MITAEGRALSLERLLTGDWFVKIIRGPKVSLNVLETLEWSYQITAGVAIGAINTVTLSSRTHIGAVALYHNDNFIAISTVNKVYSAGTVLQIRCNLYF